MKQKLLEGCNCFEGIEVMIYEGGPIYEVILETCSCYEGIDQMISEGGPAYPIFGNEMYSQPSIEWP